MAGDGLTQIHLPEDVRRVATAIIFVVSFFFICSRRIKWLPIGRPAAALVGATLMVFLGIVPPEGIGEAVNWDTIILLFGMMLISLFLEKNNIWEIAGKILLHKCTSPFVFLVRVCIICAVFSSILTNDTVCVTITPVVLEACRQAKLPYFPFLMAVATSANIGSAALPVGNPQNMIIATASEIPFLVFFKFCVVASVIGIVINTGLLALIFRKQLAELKINIDNEAPRSVERLYALQAAATPKKGKAQKYTPSAILTTPASPFSPEIHEWEDPILDESEMNEIHIEPLDLDPPAPEAKIQEVTKSDPESAKELDPTAISARFSKYPILQKAIYYLIAYRSVWVLLLVLAGFCAGFHMGFTVLLGTAILILIDRQEMDKTFMKIDWNLLIFFGALFILVRGFDNEFAEYAWKVIQHFTVVSKDPVKITIFTLLLLVGSNILSNVPLVLLLSSHLKEQNVPEFTWMLMAFVSTVAGNFTLLGSVANLIVAEKAKQHYQIGFWEYLKVGAASTVLVIAVGVPLIVVIG